MAQKNKNKSSTQRSVEEAIKDYKSLYEASPYIMRYHVFSLQAKTEFLHAILETQRRGLLLHALPMFAAGAGVGLVFKTLLHNEVGFIIAVLTGVIAASVQVWKTCQRSRQIGTPEEFAARTTEFLRTKGADFPAELIHSKRFLDEGLSSWLEIYLTEAELETAKALGRTHEGSLIELVETAKGLESE